MEYEDDIIISDKDKEHYNDIAKKQFELLSLDKKQQIIKNGFPGYSDIEVICNTVTERDEIDRIVYRLCKLELNNQH
jgi:hypothetical protein